MRKLERTLHRLQQLKRNPTPKRYRYDIKNEDVEAKLKEGYSIAKTADFFNCSYTLVKAIKQGARKEITQREVLSKPDNLCSCCGVRPRKKGNRFLCEWCFKHEESGTLADYGCFV